MIGRESGDLKRSNVHSMNGMEWVIAMIPGDNNGFK